MRGIALTGSRKGDEDNKQVVAVATVCYRKIGQRRQGGVYLKYVGRGDWNGNIRTCASRRADLKDSLPLCIEAQLLHYLFRDSAKDFGGQAVLSHRPTRTSRLPPRPKNAEIYCIMCSSLGGKRRELKIRYVTRK